jgi:hypothetical protein
VEDEELGPDEEPEQPEEEREDRNRDSLLLAVAVIIVIIIVLLLWRGCASSQRNINDAGAGNGSIVAVPKLPVDDSTVAIWVKAGADVNKILARHELSAQGAADMGDGAFVVKVADGTDLTKLIASLKADTDLVDAGNVYLRDEQSARGAANSLLPSATLQVDPVTAEPGVSPIGSESTTP